MIRVQRTLIVSCVLDKHQNPKGAHYRQCAADGSSNSHPMILGICQRVANYHKLLIVGCFFGVHCQATTVLVLLNCQLAGLIHDKGRTLLPGYELKNHGPTKLYSEVFRIDTVGGDWLRWSGRASVRTAEKQRVLPKQSKHTAQLKFKLSSEGRRPTTQFLKI